MNAKKLTLLFSFTFLFIFSVVSRIFFNDFQDGWVAYEKKDYKTTRRLWLPLAEQGDSRAQFFLGFMHDLGFGVREDDEKAVKWYRLAAEQGYFEAKKNIYNLAKKDVPEALKILVSDAENGIAEAQNKLGVMYANGLGVPQDNRQALKWYRLAAEQGVALKGLARVK